MALYFVTPLVRIPQGLSTKEVHTRRASAVFGALLSFPTRMIPIGFFGKQGYTGGAAWCLALCRVTPPLIWIPYGFSVNNCTREVYLRCLAHRRVSRHVRIPYGFSIKEVRRKGHLRCLALREFHDSYGFEMASSLWKSTQEVHYGVRHSLELPDSCGSRTASLFW